MTQIGRKAAVIGTGSIGYRHMQVLKGLNVPVVAVSIRDTRRVDLQSEGWSCAVSLQEARQAGATIAIIATDTRRHAADAEEALRLGFHVLLEKPMALSASQAKPLVSLAVKSNLGFFIGCNLRFDPGLQVVRQRLDEVGAIHSVQIECRSYLPDWRPNRDYRSAYSARADEGGVLRDLIHEIDYALWLFGIPREVCGELRNLGRLGIQSEEMAEGRWVTPSGASISISLDYLTRQEQRTLRVNGAEGGLNYDFTNRELRVQRTGSKSEETTFPIALDDLYIQQMNEFLHIVAGGAPGLISLAQDGVSALAVCDAWRQSASSHRAEQVAS